MNKWHSESFGDLTINFDSVRIPVKEADRQSGPYPYYGASGVVDYTDNFLFDGEYLLIAEDGENLRTRNTPIAFIVNGKFWVNNHAHIVTGNDNADTRFLLYALLSLDISSYLTGSTMPKLTQGNLNNISLLVPPLPEQRRIAHVLGTLDDKIENNRKTAKTLEAMAQAIFKSWFVDFDTVRAKMAGESPESICKRLKLTPEILDLFPDRLVDSELGEIPDGWVISSFLDVCDLKGGAQPPASTFVDEPLEGYVRLLQIRDFSTDSHMTYIKDSSRLKYVTEDDILIGRYGSASGDKQKDSLGRVCRGLSGAYNVALMKLEPKSIGSEFAYQVVSSSSFYDYLQGASSKAVQAGFSKSEIANLQIVLPPRKILDHYELLGIIFWAETKLISKYQNNLSKIRDTLLPKLISGEIRVPEAEHLIENMEG